MKRVFYNEQLCDARVKSTGAKCENGAYYLTSDGSYRCGVHSNKEAREKLPKNPRADAIRSEHILVFVEAAQAAAEANKQQGAAGQLTASPLRIQKEARFEPRDGFLPVFPNFKHGHGYRYLDTLGKPDLSNLSPKKLGPVMVDGVLVAHNVENYHQFAKVFPQEQDMTQPCNCALGQPHFKPLAAFYEARRAGYVDLVAHRHKMAAEDIKKQNADRGANVNQPAYAVQFRADGSEMHLTYVQSRYFYCHQMEVLATARPEFATLREWHRDGFNLEIVGYDAFQPTGIDPESLYQHYVDPSRPFGHEMVLLALLAIADPAELPWIRYNLLHTQV